MKKYILTLIATFLLFKMFAQLNPNYTNGLDFNGPSNMPAGQNTPLRGLWVYQGDFQRFYSSTLDVTNKPSNCDNCINIWNVSMGVKTSFAPSNNQLFIGQDHIIQLTGNLYDMNSFLQFQFEDGSTKDFKLNEASGNSINLSMLNNLGIGAMKFRITPTKPIKEIRVRWNIEVAGFKTFKINTLMPVIVDSIKWASPAPKKQIYLGEVPNGYDEILEDGRTYKLLFFGNNLSSLRDILKIENFSILKNITVSNGIMSAEFIADKTINNYFEKIFEINRNTRFNISVRKTSDARNGIGIARALRNSNNLAHLQNVKY